MIGQAEPINTRQTAAGHLVTGLATGYPEHVAPTGAAQAHSPHVGKGVRA